MSGQESDSATKDFYVSSFSTEYKSGGEEGSDGYVWSVPLTNEGYAAGHMFAFRINHAISGVDNAPVGSIKITIPLHILKNRNGEWADNYAMSIPSSEEVEAAENGTGEKLSEDTNWAYYEDTANSQVIIYNFREIPAGNNTYIEVGYSTTENSFSYVDMAESEPFTATIALDSDSTPNSATSDPLTVKIDTTSCINSTSIYEYPTKYKTWQDSWGDAAKPSNADNYQYLVWKVKSDISATQPYTFSFDGSVLQGYTGSSSSSATENSEMLVVGYKFAGKGLVQKENYVSDQTMTNYRYDTIITAIPKSSTYTNAYYWKAVNTIKSNDKPKDGVDDSSYFTASKTWTYTKPAFKAPGGHVDVYSRADGAYRNYVINQEKSSIFYDCNHLASSKNMKAAEYSRYDLEEFTGLNDTSISLTKLDGLDFASWLVGFTYPWTYDATTASSNKDALWKAYGVNDVTSQLINDGVYLSTDDTIEYSDSYESPLTTGTKLTSDDFRIDSLAFSWFMYDANFDNEELTYSSTAAAYDGTDVITFYGKFGKSDKWVKFGTYTITGENTGTASFDSDYVASYSDNKIVFNDDVDLVGYKLETSNNKYYTELYTVPSMSLKNSETVLSFKDNETIILINNNEAHWYEGTTADETKEVGHLYSADADYIRASQRESSIKKSVASTQQNTSKKQYTITWKIAQSETITEGTGEESYIEQSGGVFYDLLPEGSVINKDSVIVTTKDADGEMTKLDSTAYTVNVTENYKDTGRILLTVDVSERGTDYTVFFDTVHSWDSIKDFGNTVYNPVAYETKNDSITHGFPDNGGATISDGTKNESAIKDAALLSNLDDKVSDAYDSTEKKFIYSETTYDITALMSASSGLTKKVRDEGDTSFTSKTSVSIGDTYVYRLRFANSSDSKAKNMIFFDSLENYYVTGTDTALSVGESDWKGTLTGINTSQLTSKGIAPVIYISTVENLNIEEHNDLTDEDIWTAVTDDTDLSQAKAVAIDMRRDTDGEKYTLGAGESVSAYLYMKAPKDAVKAKDGASYPYTYNNIYIQNTITDKNNTTASDFLIHQDYTTVSLVVKNDFAVKKVSSENADTTIKDVEFRLFGTSDYGTDVNLIEKTNANGIVNFEDIEMGQYILQEYSSVDDYLLDTTEYTVIVDANGNVTINGETYDNNLITIANKPRVHNDISFTKIKYTTKSVYSATKVEGVKFRLSGTSDYGNEVFMYATSDESGKVTFENVEMGTYSVTELSSDSSENLSTNEDYLKNNGTYTVKVDENGTVSITGDSMLRADSLGRSYIMDYSRYHSVKFTKVDADNTTIALQGAEFKLTGTSDIGNKIELTETSDSFGIVSFSKVEAGTYVLTETAAPQNVDEYGKTGTNGTRNYVLSPKNYVVVVSQDGTFTIDGASKNQSGDYEISNTRKNDKEIIVTKVWNDTKTNDERELPTLHLSTSEPELTTTLIAGSSINTKMKTLASSLSNITAFTRSATAPSEDNMTDTNVISTEDSLTPTYMWFDNGTMYWYTAAKTATATNTSSMFKNCTAITSIDLSGIDTSQVTNMSSMFDGCKSLTTLDVSGWDTSKVTSMYYIFFGCSNLTTLDVSGWDTSQVTNMYRMFCNCSNLTTLDVSGWDTSKVMSMGYMFCNCSNLTTFDVSGWDTSKVTNMSSMFDGCKSLTTLDVSGWNTSQVTNMYRMFCNCSNLTTIYAGDKWNTENVSSSSNMFYNCTAIKNYNSSKIDKTNANTSDTGYLTYKASTSTASTSTASEASLSYIEDSAEDEKVVAAAMNERALSAMASADNNSEPVIGDTIEGTTISEDTKEASTATTDDGDVEYTSTSNILTDDTTAEEKAAMEEAGGYWKKDGNVWTYTFFVFDDGLEYCLYENKIDGYTSDAMFPKFVTVNAGGEKINTATITNTQASSLGNLSVTKTVQNFDGSESSSDESFAFTLTLSGAKISSSQVFGGVAFSDGVARFSLKNGETITFTDIPANTSYTVTEDENASYTTAISNATGTIQADNTITVNALNTHKQYVTDKTDIQFNKTVIGESEGIGTYGFTAEFSNLEAGQTYYIKGTDLNKSFTADASGNATVRLDATVHTELNTTATSSYTISGIPVGATYRFTEDAGDYLSSYVAVDETKEQVSNTKEDLALTTGEHTVTTDTSIVFTNEIHHKQNLTVTNNVLNHKGETITPDEDFTFTVYFSNLVDSFVSDIGLVSPDESGNASKTFTLKAGESVTFTDVPVGTKYLVEESDIKENYTPSYKITDFTTVANESANGSTGDKTLSTQEETINDGENATVTFTNKLANETASIKVVKTDADNANQKLSDAQFAIYDTDGNEQKVVNGELVDATTATLLDGKLIMYNIGENIIDASKVKSFSKSDSVPSSDAKTIVISDSSSKTEVVAWADSDGNVYWYSAADIVYLNSSYSMFSSCSSIESISLEGLETSYLTDTSGMFYGCSNLKSLDLTGFNTQNVTDMSQMFYGCSSLEEIKVSSLWDLGSVQNSKDMFTGAVKLPNYSADNDNNYLNANTTTTGYLTDGTYTETNTNKLRLITQSNGSSDVVTGFEVGTYVLKEVVAPNGYELAKDITFTISEEDIGGTVTLDVSDKKKEEPTANVMFVKYDSADNSKKIGGAEYALYDDTDTLVKTIAIGSNGQSEYYPLTVGKYYAVETKAPKGYTVNDKREDFEITTSLINQNVTISLYDNAMPVLVTTGGHGTQVIYIFALPVFIGSACLLLKTKRRKQRNS